MAAPKRIPDVAVKQAIVAWRGNVTAAADSLGIAPNNLRKRLADLGLDPAKLRSDMSGIAPNVPVPIGTIGTTRTHRHSSAGTHEQRNGAAIFPRRGGPASLSPVQQQAASEAAVVPMRSKQKPTRLKPEQLDRLREAKFDLQARYREDYDENRILWEFFDDGFDAWLKTKLGDKKK